MLRKYLSIRYFFQVSIKHLNERSHLMLSSKTLKEDIVILDDITIFFNYSTPHLYTHSGCTTCFYPIDNNLKVSTRKPLELRGRHLNIPYISKWRFKNMWTWIKCNIIYQSSSQDSFINK